MSELTERLVRLREAADSAVESIKVARCEGAVNWADLGCIQACHTVTDTGEKFDEVVISEASPDAHELQQAIKSRMESAGWIGVVVRTEW